jgi:hypothetical protein
MAAVLRVRAVWRASTPDVFSRATSQPNCRSSKSTEVELIINLKTAKLIGLTCAAAARRTVPTG